MINSGSTSIKFAAYHSGKNNTPIEVCRGAIDEMQTAPVFVVEGPKGNIMDQHQWGQENSIDLIKGLSFIIRWLENNIKDLKVIGAGHRIVLGGERFSGPTLIEGDVLDYLDSLSKMEPSHQPSNVEGARALAKAFPHLTQVACFDTSFHRTMPEVAQLYALPKEIRDKGVKHWGYHGISYDYISHQVKKNIPDARRVIVAHLGGGASMCAMLDGKSIDTTMGFAGLSGLPMATRSGSFPPEIIFYLQRINAYDIKTLETLLYKKSGLLGLSGITGDMETLLNTSSKEAQTAIDYFAYQVVKYTGAYTAALGGLDAFIFTAGIGEHAISFREKVCEQLAFMGIDLDKQKNQQHGPCISTNTSNISVWVIPTNEELMIAMHTFAMLKHFK